MSNYTREKADIARINGVLYAASAEVFDEIERLRTDLEAARREFHKRGWDLALLQANAAVRNIPKAIIAICSLDYDETIARIDAATKESK